jgi:DUF917 family protein
MAELREEVTRS